MSLAWNARRAFALLFVAGGLTVLACVGGAGEPIAGTTTCANGETPYNGRCFPSCGSNGGCSGDLRCFIIAPGRGVCASKSQSQCTYLGSDSKCVGVGTYTTGSRGGTYQLPYESDPPGATGGAERDYDDPLFTPVGGRGAYGAYSASDGCLGDADWETAAASGDPACGQPHEVKRCRLTNGHQCRLVDGTTLDGPTL